jgi:hypothetical protein
LTFSMVDFFYNFSGLTFSMVDFLQGTRHFGGDSKASQG